MSKAACASEAHKAESNFQILDPFFPTKGQPRTALAEYCIHCPVVKECRKYGDATGAKHGVWGGRYKE